MKPITDEDIDARFRSHAPTEEAARNMHKMRSLARSLAYFIIDVCPSGHEQTQAIAALEAATFWTNAGIARACIPPRGLGEKPVRARPAAWITMDEMDDTLDASSIYILAQNVPQDDRDQYQAQISTSALDRPGVGLVKEEIQTEEPKEK